MVLLMMGVLPLLQLGWVTQCVQSVVILLIVMIKSQQRMMTRLLCVHLVLSMSAVLYRQSVVVLIPSSAWKVGADMVVRTISTTGLQHSTVSARSVVT
jgi:hypothetical protein